MMGRILCIYECATCPLRSWRGLGGYRYERWDVCTHKDAFENRIYDIDKMPDWCPLMTAEEMVRLGINQEAI